MSSPRGIKSLKSNKESFFTTLEGWGIVVWAVLSGLAVYAIIQGDKSKAENLPKQQLVQKGNLTEIQTPVKDDSALSKETLSTTSKTIKEAPHKTQPIIQNNTYINIQRTIQLGEHTRG